jgi:protein subunit release factor A
MLDAEPDADMAAELTAEADRLERAVEVFQLRTMLRGPDDARDALLTIHPGAGGTESQDWAEMLMRMYVRWAERRGYQVSILDLLPGEEAGIKSATIEIRGEYAYGYLKAEKGVEDGRLTDTTMADKRGHPMTEELAKIGNASPAFRRCLEDGHDSSINGDRIRVFFGNP